MPRLSLLGTTANYCSKKQIWEAIESALNSSNQTVRIATVNAEFLIQAHHNFEFKDALNKMSHCTIDGSGPWFYLKLFQPKLARQINRYAGATLVQDLFAHFANSKVKFYLIGGNSIHTKQIKAKIKQLYPELNFTLEYGGKISLQGTPDDPDLISRINQAKPDILLLGIGSTRQEFLSLNPNLNQIPIIIGVGGSLDFFGVKKRAPKWIQTLGLEWLYRGLTEKKHLKRSLKALWGTAYLILRQIR